MGSAERTSDQNVATARSLEDALKAQVVTLAIPFSEIAGLASMTNWDGRTVVGPTNAINFPDFTPADLDGYRQKDLGAVK